MNIFSFQNFVTFHYTSFCVLFYVKLIENVNKCNLHITTASTTTTTTTLLAMSLATAMTAKRLSNDHDKLEETHLSVHILKLKPESDDISQIHQIRIRIHSIRETVERNKKNQTL